MSVRLESILEAVKKAREGAKKRNFIQSFELIVNLKDLDLKNPSNRISGEITLPNGFKKKNKVAVFAEGDLAVQAKNLGVDTYGRSDVESLGGDKKRAKEFAKKYDILIASVDMIPLIGKHLGQVLGPRNMMPVPVPPTASLAPIVEKYMNSCRFRVRNAPQVRVRVGDEEMTDEEVADNIQTAINYILNKLPRGIRNVRSIYVKLSMGPAVMVKI
ncbi:MAG: 50S ribosomal protein L1 [Candidatus Asgardarchaeia archaeon]